MCDHDWMVPREHLRAMADAERVAARQLSEPERAVAWAAHEARKGEVVDGFHSGRIPRAEALAWLGRYMHVFDVNRALFGDELAGLVTVGELERACVQRGTAWPGDWPGTPYAIDGQEVAS